jgi:hypothetical protein
MKIEYNLNDYVYVKLNDLGRKVHRDNHSKFLSDDLMNRLYREPVVDENGYCKFQMWDFMHIFGEHTCMGCPSCFDTMSVMIEPVTYWETAE